jgi:hypothetical protein
MSGFWRINVSYQGYRNLTERDSRSSVRDALCIVLGEFRIWSPLDLPLPLRQLKSADTAQLDSAFRILQSVLLLLQQITFLEMRALGVQRSEPIREYLFVSE